MLVDPKDSVMSIELGDELKISKECKKIARMKLTI